MKKNLANALFVLAALLPTVTFAQESSGNLYGVDSQTQSDAAAMSGGNVFDFSNSRSNPNAPGLPSFGGGPCVGEGMAASTSLAGVAIGGGKSTIDDSCQRRNWVQALIGASQHMKPEDASILMRVAVEVMRDDPYLAGPMERVGLRSTNAEAFEEVVKNDKELEKARAALEADQEEAESEAADGAVTVSSKNAVFASTCSVRTNQLPESVQEFLNHKNCRVTAQGGEN